MEIMKFDNVFDFLCAFGEYVYRYVMDGYIDRQMDGQIDRQMGGYIDRQNFLINFKLDVVV